MIKTVSSPSPKKSAINIDKNLFVSYKKTNITKEYTLGRPIGGGITSDIRLATHKESNAKRAVKIIKKTKINEDKFFQSVDILCKLTHPNILQIYEFFDDVRNYYIVTDVCNGGELIEQICEKGVFTEQKAAKLIKQVLSAVAYAHKNKIVHKDIKPENILLDDHSDDPVLKVIGWEKAQTTNDKRTNFKVEFSFYNSPEILNDYFNEKCDIWSCGVILYILLCGYPPFAAESDSDTLKLIKKGNYGFPDEDWYGVSKEAKDLIDRMLIYEPEKRYSAEECLASPWFKQSNMILNIVPLSKTIVENMKKFKDENRLSQATISFIVSQIISKEEKNELLSQFQTWDKNGDGVLTRDEIYEGYCNLYGKVMADEQVDEIMRGCDLDNSGAIDYNEFLAFSLNKKKILSRENLIRTFNKFDKDKSGVISLEEILEIFKTQGTPKELQELKKIIKEIDVNGDGDISLEEFIEMMEKLLR